MNDDALRTGLFIGGQWLDAEDKIEVVNPFDGALIAPVSAASPDDVQRAVAAARASGMEQLTAHSRYRILDQVSRLIQQRGDKLTGLLVREAGKPYRYAAGEVARARQTFSFAAAEARRISGRTMELDAHPDGNGHFAFYHRFPLGVVGAISPFNFPLNLVAHKVAPALAAGNSVILKPASTTPLIALELADIIASCGAPEGAVNVLPGSGSTLGSALVECDDVAMITFTGSLEVGRRIRRDAGMKKVTLELGSNSAVVIDDESHLEQALARCVVGAFAYSGQVCISIQRILLRSTLAARFLERFIRAVEKIKIGDPADGATELGPMIEEREAIRAGQWVDQALEQGARLLIGGVREGAVYLPTVLDNVNRRMKVVSSEVFAPVVCIEYYDEFEQALALVNDSDYGLQAGVYTSSLARAMQAFRTLEVGGVIINDFPTYRVDQMPYGGVKGSGTGREGPGFAVQEMTELKLCVLNDWEN